MASRASPSRASAPPTSSAIRWSLASCAPMTPTMAPAAPAPPAADRPAGRKALPRRLAVAVRRLAPGWRQALPGAGVLGRRAAYAAFAAAAPRFPAGRPLELTLVLADDATLRR